jgi:hypothetical protein
VQNLHFNRKKEMQKIMKIAYLILLAGLTTQVFAQARNAEFLLHNRGNLWDTMKDDGTIGPSSPTNRLETYPGMDWPGGPAVMNKDDQRMYNYGAGMWIGGKKNGTIFLTENGPFTKVDEGTFEKITKTENFIGSDNYDPNEAEEVIIAKWKTTENISVTRTSRAWSFPVLNNFIIIEYVITNESGSALTDVYIGFPYLMRPSYQDYVVHNGWGDDFNRTDEIVKYNADRKLLFTYDDTPNFSLPSDVGNFWDDVNELRTTGYAGYAMLYADAASDNRLQPANVFYAQLLNNERSFTLTSSSPENMYKILNGEDKSLQAAEEDRLTPFMLMSAGPYNMAAGESVRIVIAEAVNGIPQSEAVKGIEAQAKLPAGEDSLFSSIDAAISLFNNNYQPGSVPPPSPKLEIFSQPSNQTIAISWDPLERTWVNPVSGRANLQEFRIYRSNRAFTGPFEQVRVIRPSRTSDVTRFWSTELNKWVFEDNTISLATGYFYAVTSVDSAGNESWLTNRNVNAISASRSAAENALNVKVFPNPFKLVSGFPTSGTENYIVWTNLPAECTIRIYTSSGELVRTLEKESSNSGEVTWDQLTDARQKTAPGIYFWTVESGVGDAKGTLLIIK